MKISIAIPFYNTSRYLRQALKLGLQDDRVSEIVIVDDCSKQEEYEKLREITKPYSKVKVCRNIMNVGELRNTYTAFCFCSNAWVITLHGDNYLLPEYIDAIYKIPIWQKDIIYCPAYGNHKGIDYRQFAGQCFHRYNIGEFFEEHPAVIGTFLNTGNNFGHRFSFLEIATRILDFPKKAYIDGVFNYEWLKSGHFLCVVEGMNYVHRMHKNSAWRVNKKHIKPAWDKIIKKLEKL